MIVKLTLAEAMLAHAALMFIHLRNRDETDNEDPALTATRESAMAKIAEAVGGS